MSGSFFADEDKDKKEPQLQGIEDKNDPDDARNTAIFAYVPFLCFVPLTKSKQNQFAIMHGKQGLILLLIEIIAVLFLAIPRLSELFWAAVLILCIIFAIMGILYVLQGKTWKIPFIGDLGEKFKI
jgi:uncharacterized membrane protein